MRREIVSASPASLETGRRIDLAGTLGALSLGAFALAFAFVDPARNGWAAAILVMAFGLDVLGRVGRHIALRGRPGPVFAAIPSMVLASDRGTMAAALLFVAAALAWPDRFPIFAALLAGLMAMGGIARLAIARAVLRAEQEEGDT